MTTLSLHSFPGVVYRWEREISETEDSASALDRAIAAAFSLSGSTFGWGQVALCLADDEADMPWWISAGRGPGHAQELREARGKWDPLYTNPHVDECVTIDEGTLRQWGRAALTQWPVLAELQLVANRARFPVRVGPEIFLRGGDAGEGDWRLPTCVVEGESWVLAVPRRLAPLDLRVGPAGDRLRLELSVRWSPWSGRMNRIGQALVVDAQADLDAGRARLHELGWRSLADAP